MKKNLVIALLFIFGISFSQIKNQYQYAVLPAKYSFLNEANKYNLNSLTKSFLESQGYKVFYATDEMPAEIANNNCNKIYVDLVENNSVFLTRISIQIKDCKNIVLLTSVEGKSRDKDFRVAYNGALREAANSIKGKLVFENPYLIAENSSKDNLKIQNNIDELKETGNPVKSQLVSNYKLSAVGNKTGYKLVNENLDVVFELLKTSKSDVYIVNNKKGGVVFTQNNNFWKYDYYQDGKLCTEIIEILNL